MWLWCLMQTVSKFDECGWGAVSGRILGLPGSSLRPRKGGRDEVPACNTPGQSKATHAEIRGR